MSGLNAAHPQWVAPILGVALGLAVVASASWWRGRRRLQALAGLHASPLDLVRDLALVAAWVAIGVAWIGPHIGRRTLWLPSSGVDVVFLLDLSRSMDASDQAPSRLARSQRLADRILAGLDPRDRAALAGFAGRGVLLTPLTSDLDALRETLAALDSELIRPRGSDLGGGVRAALDAFEPDAERPATLVVLSDGEVHAGSTEGGWAARPGVRVVTVAFGTESGATIPDHGVPLRDDSGQLVVTRRNPEPLRELAETGRGRLFLTDRWGEIRVADALGEIRREAGHGDGRPVPRELPARRVVPFVLLALALVAFEGSGVLRRTPGLLWILPLVLAASGGQSTPLPCRDPLCLVEHGIDRARLGRLAEAEAALVTAALTAQDAQLSALAYYDLGVVELQRDRLEAARDAFLDALALVPDDLETRFNLEWTLRALEARAEEAPEHSEAGTGAAQGGGESSSSGAGTQPDRERQAAGREPDEPPSERGEDGSKRDPSPAEPGPQRAGGGEPLSQEEIERWLRAVRDDPAAGLRRLTREGGRQPGAASEW